MPRKKSAAKKARDVVKKELKVSDDSKKGTKVSEERSSNKIADEPTSAISNKVEVGDLEDSEDESSTSEEEDDYGELITEEVEDGIKKVLDAIKNNDTGKLLNPEVKFFEDPEKAVEKLSKTEKQKPIYLKDYHRMNLLNGGAFQDDDEDEEEPEFATVDGKQSFVSQQREERHQLLSEIKNAFSDDEKDGEDDEEEDGDFLKKKEHKSTYEPSTRLPDPEVNDEQFLEEFINKQAWIPKKGDKTLDLDRVALADEEDDEEFENAVEKFENAYNFRYEDPNAAEIVSYARNQATLRRSDTTSRRRKREEEKIVKLKEDEEKKKAIQKKKKEKVNQLTDVLEQVKKEYGAEIKEDHVKALTDTLLNGNFEDGKWDEVIGQIFNDDFYEQEGKPTWDEHDEIMGEFYDKEENSVQIADSEGEEDSESPKKKSKKERIQEKKSIKKDKKQLQEMVEKAVDEHKLDIAEKVEEERGRSKQTSDGIAFRYREVSPESFGLTTREIFTADDNDLNEFIGLKKFAPYRPKELRAKDRRKVTKSRRLREWRKKVFKSEEGLEGDEFSISLDNSPKDSMSSRERERNRNKKRKRKD